MASEVKAMKHEIGILQPKYLFEDWPGKYEVFSWLEYVVNVPNPIFLVTTRKANGAPNANLHSWGLLTGERGNYSSLLALLDHTHTYANILREGEWCVNFPSFEYYPQCFETIYCNGPENDEITEAGFTLEPATTVQAPRIAECLVNLECRLEWHRPLYEDSRWHLLVGRVSHVVVDESAMVIDPAERMQALSLMYNVRGTVNPLDGQQYGPNTLGLLGKVVKIFSDEGRPKGWRVQVKDR
jgi:flavin reductase (DIM6/NTAB) family NADH-FMN oxidoreductase RutF